MKTICVYCGSSSGNSPDYSTAAADLGRMLAERGIALVTGGGRFGLMGVIADSVLLHGGTVIGVMPRHLISKDWGHHGLSSLIEVETMHARKEKMAQLADGFIALPGGIGTMEEIVEALTWLQLGLHDKPVGLLNTRGFYDYLRQMLGHMTGSGFLKPAHFESLLVDSSPGLLLERMKAFRGAYVPKVVENSPSRTK